MPGRAAGDGQAEDNAAGLDRLVFGAKQKAYPAAANDGRDPDFLPHSDEDEADLLVARANADRRKAGVDRRVPMPDRRKSPNGRRASEYAPLRENGPAMRVAAEDGKRGPMLLVGALVIVAVFGFVVWNAYRDGLAGEETAEAPELSTAGAFKTPPRAVPEAPIVTEPVEADPAEALDGAAVPVDASDEVRPTLTPAPVVTKPVEAAAPSKVMAPPPAPLKQPAPAAVAPPVQQAAAKPVVATPPAPVKTAVATPTPAPVAVAPAPSGDGYKPAFAAYGDHVVQIAATQSEGAALAEWNKLSKAYPELLAGGEKFIVQADSNGKTVYRVRVGSFGSKADASQFCAAFKAKGGNCYPAVK